MTKGVAIGAVFKVGIFYKYTIGPGAGKSLYPSNRASQFSCLYRVAYSGGVLILHSTLIIAEFGGMSRDKLRETRVSRRKRVWKPELN